MKIVTLKAHCTECGCNVFENEGKDFFCTECEKAYLDSEIQELEEKEYVA